MKLTFLGTGTSQGVPVIGCRCPVCRSSDPRDNRLRTSALVETDGGSRIVIDTGPDFRQQMLRADVCRVDAVLLTHAHTDHIGGLDDVRALNFVDYPEIRKLDIYAPPHTADRVRRVFDYAFAAVKYRGVPVVELHDIDTAKPFTAAGCEVVPISGTHSVFEVTGYRMGDLAYLTDFKHIDAAEVAKLKGVKTLVVNALRWEPHDSHFSVGDALELIAEVAPREAYLTHASHETGLHADYERRLPEGVHAAFDGLRINI